MPKQSILCEKNIFTKSDADLCPFASQGRKWENILFYHSSHLCAHVTFNLLLTRQIFSRPLTQENLGQYPFHSPSLCLQQKITLLFLVDIFRTTVKHLISSLFTDIAYSKAHFWNKICPQNSFVSSAFHFHIKAREPTSSLTVLQFPRYLSAQSTV